MTTHAFLPDAGRISHFQIDEILDQFLRAPTPPPTATNQFIISTAATAWSLLAAPSAEFQVLVAGADPYTPAWAALTVGAISDLAYATPALTLSTANAAGSADTVIRSDATIALFDATTPNTLQPDDGAATGSASVAARRDHEHGIVCATPVATGTANAEGNATSFSRSNHVHQLHDHDHSGDAGDGGQLDWDNIWSDAVHDHSAAGEGGATLGLTAITGAGVDVPDNWYLGIGAALERIVFDAAGDITFMGCNVGLGVAVPAAGLHMDLAGGFRQSAQGDFCIDAAGAIGGRLKVAADGLATIGEGTATRTLTFNGAAASNKGIVFQDASAQVGQLIVASSNTYLDRPGTLNIRTYDGGATHVAVSAVGVTTITNLAGVGARNVVADAAGNLSAP